MTVHAIPLIRADGSDPTNPFRVVRVSARGAYRLQVFDEAVEVPEGLSVGAPGDTTLIGRLNFLRVFVRYREGLVVVAGYSGRRSPLPSVATSGYHELVRQTIDAISGRSGRLRILLLRLSGRQLLEEQELPFWERFVALGLVLHAQKIPCLIVESAAGEADHLYQKLTAGLKSALPIYERSIEIERMIVCAWEDEPVPDKHRLFSEEPWAKLSEINLDERSAIRILGGRRFDAVKKSVAWDELWVLTEEAFFYYLGAVLLQELRTIWSSGAGHYALESAAGLMLGEFDWRRLSPERKSALQAALEFSTEHWPEDPRDSWIPELLAQLRSSGN